MRLPRPVTAVMLVAALSLSAAGCARQIGSDTVRGSDVGQVQQAFFGNVERVRGVTVEEADRLQGNTTGGLIGGVAGGALGAVFGGGWGRVLAAGAGALVGATAGALAERELSRQDALEYTVRLDDGRMITIVQGPEDPIPQGSRVIVQMGGSGRARVIAA